MTDYVEGVDISEYQGANYPWKATADAGYRFAIIRATVCRSDGQVLRDKRYYGNIEQARGRDLLVGSYHYMHSTATPELQAQKFASVLTEGQSLDDSLFAWLDVEEETITAEMISRFGLAFSAACPMELGIYTSQYKWSKVQGASGVNMDHAKLWAADYGEGRTSPRIPPEWSTWLLWQHTSKGSIPTHDGNVDLNRLNPAYLPSKPPPAQATPEESAYHCLQQAEHNLEEAARFMRQAREEAAT